VDRALARIRASLLHAVEQKSRLAFEASKLKDVTGEMQRRCVQVEREKKVGDVTILRCPAQNCQCQFYYSAINKPGCSVNMPCVHHNQLLYPLENDRSVKWNYILFANLSWSRYYSQT
jgi:hypothetical protein